MTTIKDRLREAARFLGYSDRGFSVACGLRPDWLNHLGDFVRQSDIEHILQTFPNLNLYYIFIGRKPMVYGDSDMPSDNAPMRFFFDEYRALRIENQQLIAENTSLKTKISCLLK